MGNSQPITTTLSGLVTKRPPLTMAEIDSLTYKLLSGKTCVLNVDAVRQLSTDAINGAVERLTPIFLAASDEASKSNYKDAVATKKLDELEQEFITLQFVLAERDALPAPEPVNDPVTGKTLYFHTQLNGSESRRLENIAYLEAKIKELEIELAAEAEKEAKKKATTTAAGSQQ